MNVFAFSYKVVVHFSQFSLEVGEHTNPHATTRAASKHINKRKATRQMQHERLNHSDIEPVTKHTYT